MNTPIFIRFSPCLALLLSLALPSPVAAQNIYKCTRGGQVEFTDKPCAGHGELIHRADDSEIIDRYLRLGQNDAAKSYADAHQLQALYRQRLELHVQAAHEEAQHQAQMDAEELRDKQQARQQHLADAEANREQLQAENDSLRQQNTHYQNELTQPRGLYASPYWGGQTPRWPGNRGGSHDHDHDHGDHGPPGPTPPVFHPCETLAGGRLRC